MTACPTPWKIRYDSRGQARSFAKKTKGRAIHPYACPCGAWHVSSMTRREAKLAGIRRAS